MTIFEKLKKETGNRDCLGDELCLKYQKLVSESTSKKEVIEVKEKAKNPCIVKVAKQREQDLPDEDHKGFITNS